MFAQQRFPWLTFTLLISFASVNAVLYTPALPELADYLGVSYAQAEGTVAWFLIGYAIGQLIYGPLAARFGARAALLIGITLQIAASIGCALTLYYTHYAWLVGCRLLVALGAGVGLKMTFTLVNQSYTPIEASQKIAYLMLAFAITPGLAVALGGLLTATFGWVSCFIAGSIYGLLLFMMVFRLKMASSVCDKQALRWSHLKETYRQQLTNKQLLIGGLLMGSATCFVYVFAALAPFIAMELMKMSTAAYGVANILPSIGLIAGSLSSASLVKRYALKHLIIAGVVICGMGVQLMMLALWCNMLPLFAIFIPMIVIYFGLSLVLANASTLAMSHVVDKAHGSAVMNFINIGVATLVVLGIGLYSIHAMLLPVVYLLVCLLMASMTCKLAHR